jgi:hypothetical protein
MRSMAAGTVLLAAAWACDKEPAKPNPGTATTASVATTPPAPTAPAPPSKPQLAIDDTAVFVAGERMDIAAPDLKGRVVAALAGKPVEGETLVLNAARDTKMPKVTSIFAALIAKKVKGVEVHTPQRDRSAAEILFVTNVKPADCSAVGYIAKDSAITTWPVSGAVAERFTHGMAGPDLTRGSEGIRKRVLGCESSVFFVSADENVTWGLTFDLARAVLYPDDAGLPKARSAALLVKTPVSGRKVEVDLVD